MQNDKLSRYLKSLTQADFKKLLQFARSPYFNNEKKGNKVKILETYYHLLFREKRQIPSQEEFFKLAFPAQTYNENFFNKIKSSVVRLFLNFLTYEEFKRDPNEQSIYLLKGIRRNYLYQEFDNIYSKVSGDLEEKPMQNLAFYRQRCDLKIEKAVHELMKPRSEKRWALYDALEDHESSYLAIKLQLALSLKNQEAVVQENDKTIEGMDLLLASFERKQAVLPVEARVYYHAYQMLVQNSAFHFEKMEGLLLHLSHYNPEETSDLYRYAINFCVRKINEGESTYESTVSQLYDRYFSLSLQRKYLLPPDLKNYITFCCREGQFEKAKLVNAQFAEKIRDSYPEACLQYNYALIAFYEGDFRLANQLLDKAWPFLRDVFYGLDARILYWQIYYEQGAFDIEKLDLVDTNYESFRIYVRRNSKVSPIHRTNYKNFTHLFYRFVKIKQKPVGKRIKWLLKLKNELSERRNLARRKWLLKKVNEEIEKC